MGCCFSGIAKTAGGGAPSNKKNAGTRKKAYAAELLKAKTMVKEKIHSISCGPILIRLAWHDSGTYDKNNEAKGEWPCGGGAIGSIRFDKEINAGPNAGLAKAIKEYLGPIKQACPLISWADLMQMGSAESVRIMGGPRIPMKYGRVDADMSPDLSVAPFGLPDAKPPFGGPPNCAQDPAAHLRHVFYKYGFNDQEIVAISGAHTIGRAFKDRSGTVDYGYMKPTAYTIAGCPVAHNSRTNGGQSWTKHWLRFDNSYYQFPGIQDKECVAFPTDTVLATDPGFKPHTDKYAADQDAFFADYALAHKKLSELGSKFDNDITMDSSELCREEYKQTLIKAKAMVNDTIKNISCGPILIRTAWHDSGTYDKNNEGKGPWPCAGGAIGSIRFDKEINAGPNAGLAKAITQYLGPIKEACPAISWADLIQLGSAESVKAMGGPTIPMKYGRVDAHASPDIAEAPFGLPDAKPPFGGPPECAEDPAAHLRYVFYKYGFNDQEIVALSGAHTIGRAFKDRSGAVDHGYMNPTAYTGKGCPFAGNSITSGGQSWTKNWQKFDNSYFQFPGTTDPECIAFPTDTVLATDPQFKPTTEIYAKSQDAFFKDYALAHKKLSELGSRFDQTITINGSELN